MCGIVGYVGNKTPIQSSSEDSDGWNIAAMTPPVSPPSSKTARCISGAPRANSKICALLVESPLPGHIGIGHTRWATHGKPSEENAHPHKAGPVAVIHNGIVENFVALRAELVARGHKMKSETDTELISHLIEENLERGLGLTEAVRAAVASCAARSRSS